jgi:hypothetical protein
MSDEEEQEEGMNDNTVFALMCVRIFETFFSFSLFMLDFEMFLDSKGNVGHV